MVRRVLTVLVDDLDDAELVDDAGAETVAFALDGATYEIDLSAEHAAELRAALDPYVTAGRRAGRRGGRKRDPLAPPTAAEIREWARANGHDVSPSGRVPKEIRAAYNAR